MNFGEMKTRVRLQLGNLPVNHAFYTEVDGWVNDAIRDLPRRLIVTGYEPRNLFPELERSANATVVLDQSWIELPDPCLAPLEVFAFRTEAVVNNDNDRTYPINRIDWEEYEVLDKSTANAWWTRLWCWRTSKIFLYPTPRTGYHDTLKLYYMYDHQDFTTDGQTPTLNPRWHRAVTDLSCAYGEAAQNHPQRASFWEEQADARVKKALDAMGVSMARAPRTVAIYDEPKQGDIYGER